MSTLPDLRAIFGERVASEFVAKDVDATMRTMTAEPDVWYVPALTGGADCWSLRRRPERQAERGVVVRRRLVSSNR